MVTSAAWVMFRSKSVTWTRIVCFSASSKTATADETTLPISCIAVSTKRMDGPSMRLLPSPRGGRE